MPDFTAARINMVDSQIHPMGVTDEAILEAYRTVRREDFVPQERRAIAYCDEDMPVGAGRCLMEPSTHARLMQAAQPRKTDIVLDIGGASGYSAAVLAGLTSRVMAVEQEPGLIALAEAAWLGLGITNIKPLNASYDAGYLEGGPYNLIFINGTMASIPKSLSDQLAPEGRLVGVIKGTTDKIGRAVLIKKDQSGATGERILFDAAVPYLPGQQPRNEFVF